MGDRSALLLRAARSAARLRLPIDEATQRLLTVGAGASDLDLAAAIQAAEHLPAEDADTTRAREILQTARDVRLFPAA